MRQKTALKIILAVSIAGLLFSGYLSYREYFGPTAQMGAVTCTEAAGFLPGPPVCVYGFAMYAIVFVMSLLGLKGKE